MGEIREAIEEFTGLLAERPELAAGGPSATATLESGLKFRVSDVNGTSIETDMPPRLGGGATAPTPGWFQVAAMASCTATVIAMRAAQLDVELTKLEVSVKTANDARGLLGTDEAVSAGLSSAAMDVHLAGDATADQLREIARWAYEHSPVATTIKDGPPISFDVAVEE